MFSHTETLAEIDRLYSDHIDSLRMAQLSGIQTFPEAVEREWADAREAFLNPETPSL